jgi:hypothetical protein
MLLYTAYSHVVCKRNRAVPPSSGLVAGLFATLYQESCSQFFSLYLQRKDDQASGNDLESHAHGLWLLLILISTSSTETNTKVIVVDETKGIKKCTGMAPLGLRFQGAAPVDTFII